eukprot:CAMPEP_0184649962 /NCGR_PEP_ID=MMETSP0308-20130426/7432_1 /TAXON_ID=38269 /ORGANISM="Gloeochaete witrockiana, Strain SAG 46.84" /LENGTH=319 /DNA_ID=CAMNT_0027083127 /DNA_START=395 /DNA_END=1354 /DNA_ORIENTATION=+
MVNATYPAAQTEPAPMPQFLSRAFSEPSPHPSAPPMPPTFSEPDQPTTLETDDHLDAAPNLHQPKFVMVQPKNSLIGNVDEAPRPTDLEVTSDLAPREHSEAAFIERDIVIQELTKLIEVSICRRNTEQRRASWSTGLLRPLELPVFLIDRFETLAKPSTDRELETCAVICGEEVSGRLVVRALILPNQTATSCSCSMQNEEQIIEVQQQKNLMTLGWIHTHPKHQAFMSSVDIHTQFSFQVLLPEAIAVVVAPNDPSGHVGIFRLTTAGLTVVHECTERGFHLHSEQAKLYDTCEHVELTSVAGDVMGVYDLRDSGNQ